MGTIDREDELGAVEGRQGATAYEVPLLAIWAVECSGNATEVLATARDGMRAILDPSVPLPARMDAWFRDEPGVEELLQRAREPGTVFSWTAPSTKDDRWDRRRWAFWMERCRRAWIWRDAEVVDPDRIRLRTEVEELEFPWGSLLQLFLAAGASDVEMEGMIENVGAIRDHDSEESPEEAVERALIEEVERGMSLLALGDAARAIQMLETALPRSGDTPFPRLHEGLGRARLLSGDLDEALVALDASLIGEDYPEVSNAFFARARVLVFLGRCSEVISALSPMVEATPTHRRAAETLALARRVSTLTPEQRSREARLDSLEQRAAALDAATREDDDVALARRALRVDLERARILSTFDTTAELPILRSYARAAAEHVAYLETGGDPVGVDLDWFRLPHATPEGIQPRAWTDRCVAVLRDIETRTVDWNGRSYVLFVRQTDLGTPTLVGGEPVHHPA